MSILTPRVQYSPFEYQEAFRYCELQQQSHWLVNEVNFSSDVHDWKMVLNDAEKQLVGHILKSFTQSEVFIGEYWSGNVSSWFKKPEIQMMASTFSAMEAVHAIAYAQLNTSLGLEDFSAFLSEPTGKAKIDRLINTRGKSKEQIAKSLAIFSGFNEGVNLFSSFAILLNFSRFNKLKGVGQVVAFSIKDESLHSDAGCWLFRTLIQEHPVLWTDELKEEIVDASRTTVELEDAFIDQAFSFGEVEGITPQDVKAFIRHRANMKLIDLGLAKNWKTIDKEVLARMDWFDTLSSGVQHSDFFASRVSDYSKGTIDFSNIWDDK